MEVPKENLATRYGIGEGLRETWMQRARRLADLTNPTLYLRQNNSNRNTRNDTNEPNQSFTQQLHGNLSNKIMAASWPAAGTAFRFAVDPVMAHQAAAESDQDVGTITGAISNAVAMREEAVRHEMKTLALRPQLKRQLEHILIGGQGLIYISPNPKDSTVKCIAADKLVTWRDGSHKVLEWVAKECISARSLPSELQTWVSENNLYGSTDDAMLGSENDGVELYTSGKRISDTETEVWQEIGTMEVPNSRKTYKDSKNPWIISGGDQYLDEHYRRGYEDDYYRDLQTIDGIDGGMLQRTALFQLFGSKLFAGKGRNGVSMRTVINSGPLVRAEATDYKMIEFGNGGGWDYLEANRETKRRDLSKAFLLTSGLIRDAERVTAQEVRMLGREVEESSLSGWYAAYQTECMLPVIRILLTRIEKRHGKFLEALPEGVVPVITTGLEALSRAQMADERLLTAEQITKVFPQTGEGLLEPHEIISDTFRDRAQDATRYVRTRQELEQQQAEASAQQMVMEAGAQQMSQPPQGAQ